MAIFTVLISHSLAFLPEKFNVIHHLIFDGVLVFFVLSGFLIGRIFIKQFEHQINIVEIFKFWKRRWLRTLPAYFFTILLIVLLSPFLGLVFDKKEIIRTIFFIQNLTYRHGAFFPESWSLSIEEWFYLALPVSTMFFSLLFRRNIKLIVSLVAFLVIVGSLCFRYFISQHRSIISIYEWDYNLRCAVITRLDSLMIGVLGAWFYHYKNQLFFKYKEKVLVLGLILFLTNKFLISFEVLTFAGFYMKVVYFTVLPLSILLMMPFVYYLNPVKINLSIILLFKGSLISYSLYLLNLTIVSLIILSPLQINHWYKFFLFWFLSIIFAVLMYKYIEIPFMKLQDKKAIKK